MKDKIFQNPKSSKLGSFAFNQEVADVFEDMLERSIPHYREVIGMTIGLITPKLLGGRCGLLYDLGCSHGGFLDELAAALRSNEKTPSKPVSLVGIDSSAPLIAKARERCRPQPHNSIEFVEAEIEAFDLQPCSVVTAHYTLQFVAPSRRKALVEKIFCALEPGGFFVVSEKVSPNNQRFERTFVRAYHDFKRSMGYSELEIERKQKALKNVLIPYTPESCRRLLAEAGFATQEVFFQWYNFISIVAIK